MPIPYAGELFTFHNPDGSTLQVRGFGNQFAAYFETLDGYTVIKEPQSGVYQYAQLAPDKATMLPSGVPVGSGDPRALSLPQHLRPAQGTMRRLALAAHAQGPQQRWEIRRMEKRAALRRMDGPGTAPPRRAITGDYCGLCLLVQFPDVTGTIARDEVDRFCNLAGYDGFGNRGSVHDYFRDVSGGRLRYRNVVTAYYTAAHERSYYTDPSVAYGTRTRELIVEALDHLRAGGFDFGQLSSDSEGYVYAMNVFYAGPRVNGWSEGLWPHAWSLATPYRIDDSKRLADYQITNMGSSLTLRTFCHENGHMLCDFPDLYDYGGEGSGVGHFCLMCYGGSDINPTQVSAYLKHAAGWATSAATINRHGLSRLNAERNEFLLHRKSATEYFILENRQQSGRDAALPGAGLLVWHVDELGSNNHEQMTPAQHYELSLEQADGRFDMEHRANYGDVSDVFGAPGARLFGDATTPSSKWWDGSSSGLEIVDVSESGPVMTLLTGGVVVYEHNDYRGRSQALAPGRHDLAQLTIGNDCISSVRVPAGWRVTLYQHAGFRGETRVLTADSPSLPGFNDTVSSIEVEKDVLAVVYEHVGYEGRSQILDFGRYDLAQLTIGNDRISSMRVPAGWRVTLYQHAGFRGATRVLTADAPRLSGFNDTVSSIVLEPDALAVVYQHAGYGGNCQVLEPGRYDLSNLTIGNDVISSVRVPAGWRITLYQHAGFRGATRVLTGDAPRLPGFNDVVSSIVVEADVLAVVYEHVDYVGQRQVLSPGRYDLSALTLRNDSISSVRVPAGWRVTLYQHAGFRGETRVLTADTPRLPGFNDTVSSIVVEHGRAEAHAASEPMLGQQASDSSS